MAACRSAGCWPKAAGADEPTDYWLSNLPPDTRSPSWPGWPDPLAVEHDYRELKTGLGLGHFEGRSFTGWHRHVTLAVLAQAFCTMIRTDPKALRRDDPVPGAARTAARARPILGACPCAAALTRLRAVLLTRSPLTRRGVYDSPSRDGSFAADLPAGLAAFMADAQVPWSVGAPAAR